MLIQSPLPGKKNWVIHPEGDERIVIQVHLDDQASLVLPSPTLDTEIVIMSQSVSFAFRNHGDAYAEYPQGIPVQVCNENDTPVIRLWNDINEEDPSHIIHLSGAKESNRY